MAKNEKDYTVIQQVRIIKQVELLKKFVNHPKSDEMILFVSEKKFRNDNEKISYRILTHWEKLGLIDNDRPDGKGWRKFSLIDLVWMRMIIELRNFGFPNEKIKALRDQILSTNNIQSISESFLFQCYLSIAITAKLEINAFIFLDGVFELATLQEWATSVNLDMMQNHIRISINEVLSKVLPKKEFKVVKGSLIELNNAEMGLLAKIRLDNFDSISIKLKDGKIEKIESEQLIKTDEKITDLLKESNYQDIEIKQRGGKIVSIKRKELDKTK